MQFKGRRDRGNAEEINVGVAVLDNGRWNSMYNARGIFFFFFLSIIDFRLLSWEDECNLGRSRVRRWRFGLVCKWCQCWIEKKNDRYELNFV